jgi:hypothetical protein
MSSIVPCVSSVTSASSPVVPVAVSNAALVSNRTPVAPVVPVAVSPAALVSNRVPATLVASSTLEETFDGPDAFAVSTPQPIGNLDTNPTKPKKRKLPGQLDGFCVPEKSNSFVWKYFRIRENQMDQKKAFCTLCHHWRSWARSTTNLINHLRSNHDILAPKAVDTKQPTLVATVSTPLSEVKKSQITRAIGWMIAKDFEPFALTQHKGFQQLIHLLEPRYKMPDRKFFSRTMIPQMFAEEREKFQG